MFFLLFKTISFPSEIIYLFYDFDKWVVRQIDFTQTDTV